MGLDYDRQREEHVSRPSNRKKLSYFCSIDMGGGARKNGGCKESDEKSG